MDSRPALIQSPMDLGSLIQKRRRALKMSQETLASLTGIAQPNLSNIERGQTTATIETYLRLLTSLGIDLYGEVRQ
jgi:transcriptional regulator with XRE-family HTH domain